MRRNNVYFPLQQLVDLISFAYKCPALYYTIQRNRPDETYLALISLYNNLQQHLSIVKCTVVPHLFSPACQLCLIHEEVDMITITEKRP